MGVLCYGGNFHWLHPVLGLISARSSRNCRYTMCLPKTSSKLLAWVYGCRSCFFRYLLDVYIHVGCCCESVVWRHREPPQWPGLSAFFMGIWCSEHDWLCIILGSRERKSKGWHIKLPKMLSLIEIARRFFRVSCFLRLCPCGLLLRNGWHSNTVHFDFILLHSNFSLDRASHSISWYYLGVRSTRSVVDRAFIPVLYSTSVTVVHIW
jgi:hypothetical protein